jgi:hypothetical protein
MGRWVTSAFFDVSDGLVGAYFYAKVCGVFLRYFDVFFGFYIVNEVLNAKYHLFLINTSYNLNLL